MTMRRAKEALKIPLMLTPAVGLIVLLFGGGLLVGFGQSLGYFPAISLPRLHL